MKVLPLARSQSITGLPRLTWDNISCRGEGPLGKRDPLVAVMPASCAKRARARGITAVDLVGVSHSTPRPDLHP